MMRRGTLFAGCLMAVFAVTAHAEPTALQVTKPIYQWKTESNNDDKGFNHCLVKNMYDNGTMMILAENRDDVTRLALHFPQDKMQPNQQFDLTIQIDKRDVFPVEAVAINSQVLTIGIPEALPDQMRKGAALHLRGPSDEVVFTLDGMSGAVLALHDCVATNKKLAAGQKTAMVEVPDDLLDDTVQKSDSAVKKPEVVVPKEQEKKAAEIVTAKTEEKKPVTQSAPAPKAAPKTVAVVATEPKPVPAPLLPPPMDAIMTQAGLMPKALLMGKTGQAGNKPLDYAWQQEDLFVGIKQQTATTDLSAASTLYMRGLRATCAGEFVAEASELQKHGTASWIVAEVACAPRQGAATIGALLFYNDGKTLRITFVESPSTSGARAIKARNAVLKASAAH